MTLSLSVPPDGGQSSERTRMYAAHACVRHKAIPFLATASYQKAAFWQPSFLHLVTGSLQAAENSVALSCFFFRVGMRFLASDVVKKEIYVEGPEVSMRLP